MESDGRLRSSTQRNGSRRNGRNGDRTDRSIVVSSPTEAKRAPNGYSSTDEEGDDKVGGGGRGGFLSPLKAGDRGGTSGRSRVSPLDLIVTSSPADRDVQNQQDKNFTTAMPLTDSQQPKGGYQDPRMNQPPPHYFQDYRSNNEYESPMLKGKQRGGQSVGRRLGGGPHGSSMSSSDNNSDTTYAESDINNSLRTRMAALDNAGTPPDPAPPEVPPRGPSHHHPLLSSQRRGMGNSQSSETPGAILYQEGGPDDMYQQPGGANMFLSQEYLMSGTNPRYVGSVTRKSPMGHPIFGSSPTRDGIPSDYSQPTHLITTFGSQKDVGALNCTQGTFATTDHRNNLNSMSSRPSFSGRKLRLEKSWKEKFSWRCASIFLLLLCAVLIAMLTFFAASYATLDSRARGCIVVEDAARVVAAAEHTTKAATEYPTPVYTIPVPKDNPNDPPQRSNPGQSNPGGELPLLQVFNRRYTKDVDPKNSWNVQFVVKQPTFIRFNLSVPRSAQLAFFGRRNVAPSITQYDFVKFISSGRRGRTKRETGPFVTDAVDLPSDILRMDLNRFTVGRDFSSWPWLYVVDGYGSEVPYVSVNSSGRTKRYLERVVNVTIVEFLDTGKWYLSVYNDGLGINQVSLIVEEAPELQSACTNDCSGRGSCILGQCDCIQGWVGEDCSKSVCPVLCSGHGAYGGGLCHCETGWKGLECDVPHSDCEVPDCNERGSCRSGTCVCIPGWKGDNCYQVDCKDPSCSGHGTCVEGTCLCHAGWTGQNCSRTDEKVFTCLPDCSGKGRYNLQTSSCICNEYWGGPDCSLAKCTLDCVHGDCDGSVCVCDEGWMGTKCAERACDTRCSLHGQCHNGTCLCVQGWNGKHCTIPGCMNSCSGNGICTTEDGVYRCSCSPGWMGSDCSVAMETQCSDDKDNDGDSLVDCSDSECCSTPECRDHVMCMVSSDPVEVLLRKQPPAVTASFYQKVKFIIEDRNVQSFARKEEFTERRVSVIRGRVVTTQGQGIVGVRTSIEKESKYGLTATRKHGWFDVLVNGGGAVTLQFQRAHFEPLTFTVPVMWNKIIVLEPITMHLKNSVKPQQQEDPESLWSEPCLEHDYGKMRPQVIPTYLPRTIGSAPQSSVVFTEAQVVQESLKVPGSDLRLIYLSSSVSGYLTSLLLQLTPDTVSKTLSMVHLKVMIEGTIFEKVFEADPNINFTFSWNKRNVYKQKVYGEAIAEVSVGYEYTTCGRIVWEVQTASVFGFPMDISDIGGWNLDIHHMYNFESGLLQRGDGSTLNLRDSPRIVSTLIGTGAQRTVACKFCAGRATDAELLTPSTLVTGPDGSVYVGDFNLIRRVGPDGMVSTILELSSSQVSHGYYLALSPVDGRLYVSDPSKYRIISLFSVSNVTDPINNFETVAGNGERCIPGDEHHCGDKGPAKRARLSHPKGLAIAADRTMYIADGTNIRVIDGRGIIHTLIGHHGHKNRWKPFPCSGGMPASQVELQWPTELALSTLDNSLHILDDHVILQVTRDGMIRVRVGRALHCKSTEDEIGQSTIVSFAFSPTGSLFIAEESAKKNRFIREVFSNGENSRFAGASFQDCGCPSAEDCSCPQDKFLLSTNVLFGRVSSVSVTPDGVVHVADLKALKVFSFRRYLPNDDQNGDYHVSFPNSNELYIFNRHGHHIETRDLTTGRTIYSFLYSKNTSFGRLSKVTDSSGNKIMFLRDYKSAVSQIENTAGEKFKVDISRLGLMTSFTERAQRWYHFTYDDDTGLLLSTTAPGSLTTIYEYNEAGQLETVITPTGSRVGLRSWIGDLHGRKHLEVGVGQMKPYDDDQNERFEFTLSMYGQHWTEFKHGKLSGTLQSYPNGSSIQIFPWGGFSSSMVTMATNPLLESMLPTQARLFPLSTLHLLQVAPDEEPNRLVMSYGVVADKNLRDRLVEKVILVNGTRVLSQRWRGSDRTNKITDGERGSLLETTYNENGRPTRVIIGQSVTSVNISYDRFGRIDARRWERTREDYDYNSRGLLSATKTRSGSTKFSFRNTDRLLESITLPSGRTWTYNYDSEGGLKYITTPSGSAHTFSVQLYFGFYVFSYTPPGASHAFRQHLDHNGRLKLTVFPSGYPKILFDYNDAGQLKSIVSGDGKTSFMYSTDGLVEEIFHRDSDVDYKMDFLYSGARLTEYQINYGPRNGLSNAKFIYEYDSNFRLSALDGRIGGQSLLPFTYKYSPTSGKVTEFGSFKVSRPGYNETIVHDGTAIFSRRYNSQFKITRLSVTIHKMEVFRMDLSYTPDGNIGQSDTYTRNFHTKPYMNTKNYTYDADGQLIAVAAKEPWSFTYDAFGNMLSLTYSTNTIPMKYDARDKIIKFGEGGYKYDQRGNIVQNVRDVNYRYNARGMLVRASKAGRFNIVYSYDHESRLVARRDNFGNVTQFLYANPTHPKKVSHIYNPRDGHLITLTYDDRGHVIYAQVYRNKYYIATDGCGTPIMMFNQYGEVVREMMRSPYGHIIYDSNPYLYLPVDYCGGILDARTELIHMPGGRVYDPLIGLWLSPAWDDVPANLMTPNRLSLYRFNGNDPINVRGQPWTQNDERDWLKVSGYDVSSLAPQLYVESPFFGSKWDASLNIWESFSKLSLSAFDANQTPFSKMVKKKELVSGFVWNQRGSISSSVSSSPSPCLAALTTSKLRNDFAPHSHSFEISTVPGPFGKGILVSVVKGRAIVSSTPESNPIFKDVLTSVFNNAFLLDHYSTSHSAYVFYFVKRDFWKASEDMTQLNRLAGEVNITIHEPNSASGDLDRNEKVVDVKLHSVFSIIHVRYGTQPQLEKKRLLKHAKKMTIRKAWADERDQLAMGLRGSFDWTPSEVEQLLNHQSSATPGVPAYNARYLNSPDQYPELVDDPSNIRFIKDTKRTRRNSKGRNKTHRRCRRKRKWWAALC